MSMTAYDKSVEAAKEMFRKEARDEAAQEYLDREKESHKSAARIWFNALTECWPPQNTERYFEAVSEQFNRIWNENKDNELLHKLLLMTHEYLGETAEEHKRILEGKKVWETKSHSA